MTIVPIIPLLVLAKYRKCRAINQVCNLFYYAIKLLIPFMVVNLLGHLVTLPLVYVKVLNSIYQGEYQDINFRSMKVDKSTKVKHFLQFLFLGIPFLLFRLVVVQSVYTIRRSRQEVPESYLLIFNRELYHVFKKTIQYFTYEKRMQMVRVGEINHKLQSYYEESKSTANQVNLQIIKDRLRICAEESNMMINTQYFLQMINQMKNKKILKDKSQAELLFQKMKQMQIIFN